MKRHARERAETAVYQAGRWGVGRSGTARQLASMLLVKGISEEEARHLVGCSISMGNVRQEIDRLRQER